MTSRALSLARWDLRQWNWEPLRLPLSVLGAFAVVGTFVLPNSHGWDLTAFRSINLAAPYALVPEGLSGYGAFRYAPPMALLMAPLSLVPWNVLVVAWLAAQLACLRYIGGRWFLVLVLFPPVWLDLAYGNINVFLAAAVVAGFRYPGAWAFVLLTKITPGVGLVWFLVRREWRALGIALGATAALSLVSVLVMGTGVWFDWFALIAESSRAPVPFDALPVPLVPRIIGAALLTAWGGLTGRQWVVPVAVCLAMPTLWLVAFAPLVALGRARPS